MNGSTFPFHPPVWESRQFVARRHQDYLFCLVECKVNRRGRAKISEQTEEEEEGGGGSTGAQRKIKPGAEREMMWRDEDSQDIKKHTEMVKGRRRWGKDGARTRRWTDGCGP